MGQVFGKADPNATNTMQGGNVVATDTPGGQVMADPNQGLSGGQMFARKALAGSLSGLGQGLQQQNNPNPQFNFSQFRTPKPTKQPLQTGVNGNSNPFTQGPNPNLYG